MIGTTDDGKPGWVERSSFVSVNGWGDLALKAAARQWRWSSGGVLIRN
jgi:hypothetical protein